MMWQPIETAPHETEVLLAFFPSTYISTGIFEKRLSGTLGWWPQMGNSEFIYPTHWQPLPDPPTN